MLVWFIKLRAFVRRVDWYVGCGRGVLLMVRVPTNYEEKWSCLSLLFLPVNVYLKSHHTTIVEKHINVIKSIVVYDIFEVINVIVLTVCYILLFL